MHYTEESLPMLVYTEFPPKFLLAAPTGCIHHCPEGNAGSDCFVLYLWEYRVCLSKFNGNLTKFGFDLIFLVCQCFWFMLVFFPLSSSSLLVM